MLILIFALISLAVTVLCAVLGSPAPAELWKYALLFVLGVPAVTVLYVLGAAVCSLFITTDVPKKKQSALCRAICRGAGDICCFYGRVRTHVSGTEKLPADGRFLLVGNHRSAFDPLALLHSLPEQNIAFISKPENMKLPVVGRIAYGACFLPIDRDNAREALATIRNAETYLNGDMCSICIFPEGTRSHTRELLAFHAGSFKIAHRAKVPLVIASISGTDRIRGNFPLRRTDVYIDILQTVPYEELRTATTAELAEKARTMITGKLAERENWA